MDRPGTVVHPVTTPRAGQTSHLFATAIGIFGLVCISGSALGSNGKTKQVHAALLERPPVIDGLVQPGEWKQAAVISDFVQTVPNTGRPPRVETLVLLGYDNQALYLAFVCRQKGLVSHRARSERDAVFVANTDWIAVMLDPFRDRRTGYMFQLSAAGIQADAAIFQDGRLDMNWDAVWNSAVAHSSESWTAEIRIPWNSIDHPTHGANRSWGLQLRRRTVALEEIDDWAPVPRGSSGLARHFGDLKGLSNITRTLSLELRPYLASGILLHQQASLPASRVLPMNVGFGLRYGLTPSLTLSVAVNPDFGQVELDPTIVNLTNYEVYLPEKRPFFVEDADLFKTPLSIFYSRRVGAAPPIPDPTTPDGTVVQTAGISPILFAAKLTGRAGQAWRLGALTALVGPTHAVELRADGRKLDIQTSGTEAFSTMRAVRSLGHASSLGLAMASVQRERDLDAYVLSADTTVREFAPYSVTAQCVTSLEKDHQGWGLVLGGGRTESAGWRWNINGGALSRHLDLNQTGFLSRNSLMVLNLELSYLFPKPTGLHRRLHVGLAGSVGYNFDGVVIQKKLTFWSSHTFTSTWTLSYRYQLRLPFYDDWTTSGGIPVRLPKQHLLFANIGSDRRKRIRGQIWSWVLFREDDSVATSTSTELSVQFGRSFQASINTKYTARRNWLQYASSDKIDRPIFGRMDFDQLESSLHLQALLGGRFTLQLYMQYLYAVARFRSNRFFILYGMDEPRKQGNLDTDWSMDALTINLRLRWQIDAATNLYLMASHLAQIDGADPKFKPLASLDRSWTTPATDILLFKLERRWIQ